MCVRVLARGGGAHLYLAPLQVRHPTLTRHTSHTACMIQASKHIDTYASQFEAGFTSLAHTEADITATVEAAKRVLKRI